MKVLSSSDSKGVTKDRRILFIICFDRKDQFSCARPAIYSDNTPGVSGQAGMDAKYTLSVTHLRKASDRLGASIEIKRVPFLVGSSAQPSMFAHKRASPKNVGLSRATRKTAAS